MPDVSRAPPHAILPKRWYRRRWVWMVVILIFLASPAVLSFGLYACRSRCTSSFGDALDPQPLAPLASLPDDTRVSLTFSDRDDALARGFREPLMQLSSPRGNATGSIALEANSPTPLLPLLKCATISYVATASLVCKRGEQFVRVSSQVSGTLEMSCYGLVSIGTFDQECGRAIGSQMCAHLEALLAR